MPGYKKSQVLYRDLAPFHPFLCRLDDVGSLRATRTFDNLELDILTLIERLEAFVLDCGEMDEYIIAAFARDEAVAFLRTEPFYFANHNDSSYTNQKPSG